MRKIIFLGLFLALLVQCKKTSIPLDDLYYSIYWDDYLGWFGGFSFTTANFLEDSVNVLRIRSLLVDDTFEIEEINHTATILRELVWGASFEFIYNLEDTVFKPDTDKYYIYCDFEIVCTSFQDTAWQINRFDLPQVDFSCDSIILLKNGNRHLALKNLEEKFQKSSIPVYRYNDTLGVLLYTKDTLDYIFFDSPGIRNHRSVSYTHLTLPTKA